MSKYFVFTWDGEWEMSYTGDSLDDAKATCEAHLEGGYYSQDDIFLFEKLSLEVSDE